mgnify:CR=1 FL=1|tara:strand:+ start:1089 stop:1760 length:672 start_codon:yes stop_codon:yes gene_type:complete
MSNYFSQVPDFEYTSILPDAKLGDFFAVKNFFKRGKLRDDIIQNVAVFEKYQIKGNDRPDNVAFDFYGDSSLDWVVLLSNNILNIQTEWPLLQNDFDSYLLEKYGDYQTLYSGIHHHESMEIKNAAGVVVFPEGIHVDSPYNFSYYDAGLEGGLVVTQDISTPVTNYQYEEKIEDEKRNIFLLKPRYLNVVKDDLEELMLYKKGSTQYVSETLKKADNIRLYQ